MNNLFQPDKDYMVLARCHTYNHEKYIEHTLNGFVMQKTSFPFCAVVIDDCSTDTNQEVISQYVKSKCGESIEQGENENFRWMIGQPAGNEQCTLVVLLLKYNHYQKGLVMRPYYEAWQNACKYEAICEGDDYWIDPLKLQKQVDILEADDTLMGCCTNRRLVDFKGNTLEEKRPFMIEGRSSCRISLRDYFRYNVVYPTASVVYRNSHREEVQQKANHMKNPYLGDWTMWIALHCFGDFYYLDEVTSAYRQNPTSVTHTQWKRERVAKVKYEFDLQPRVADVLPDEYADIAAELRNTNWVHGALVKAYYKDKAYLKMVGQLFVVAVKFPQYYKELAKRVLDKIKRKLHIK